MRKEKRLNISDDVKEISYTIFKILVEERWRSTGTTLSSHTRIHIDGSKLHAIFNQLIRPINIGKKVSVSQESYLFKWNNKLSTYG